MRSIAIFALVCSLFAPNAYAGAFVNTLGSDARVAIAGFDAVAFFIEKRAKPGKPDKAFEWMGAMWYFDTQANLEAFRAEPEKYAPQYGGHCTWGVSENLISSKPFAGSFEVMNGKLYLFAPGRTSADGANRAFWDTGGGLRQRISAADGYWPNLKTRLEEK